VDVFVVGRVGERFIQSAAGEIGSWPLRNVTSRRFPLPFGIERIRKSWLCENMCFTEDRPERGGGVVRAARGALDAKASESYDR